MFLTGHTDIYFSWLFSLHSTRPSSCPCFPLLRWSHPTISLNLFHLALWILLFTFSASLFFIMLCLSLCTCLRDLYHPLPFRSPPPATSASPFHSLSLLMFLPIFLVSFLPLTLSPFIFRRYISLCLSPTVLTILSFPNSSFSCIPSLLRPSFITRPAFVLSTIDPFPFSSFFAWLFSSSGGLSIFFCWPDC